MKKKVKGEKKDLATKAYVKKTISADVEHKFILPGLAYADQSTTAAITGLTDNVQGITDLQHIGDRLRLDNKMYLKYTIRADTDSDVNQQLAIVRIIIFQWKNISISGGGSEPTTADILLTGPSGAIDENSHYNVDQAKSYHIVFDKTHTIVGQGQLVTNAYNTHMIQHYTRTISLKKCIKRLDYVAASNTTAKNHLYMCSFSNLAPDAQNPQLTWMCKIPYTDA